MSFQEECENNIAFYTHLKIHLNRSASYSETSLCCDYCIETFSSQEKKIFHQRVVSQEACYSSLSSICSFFTFFNLECPPSIIYHMNL